MTIIQLIVLKIKVASYQRAERIAQSEIQCQRLQLFEEVSVFKFDRVGRNVLLHAVFASAVRVALDLGDGGTFAGRRSQRRRRFVRLSRGSIEGHDPKMRLGLVISREDHAIAFLHGVEEEATALQIFYDGA